MPIFVAVIAGKSVAAFQAVDDSAARERARDRVFRDDLMTLQADHVPLWDGIADIEVRDARSEEAAKWRVSHARALRRGDIDPADDAWIKFLVTLTAERRGPQATRNRR